MAKALCKWSFYMERLDWAFANNDWFLRFTRTREHHLNANSSNHCPLWIIPNGLDHPCISKPFRFEEMWLSDKGCTKTVKAVWLSHDCLDPSKRAVQLKVEQVELKIFWEC